MKILVVDDEKLLVKGIKFNLENEGYAVDCAYDGEEAVSLARTGGYDLIILDLMMPKKTGLEACLEIREFSAVPIIMLTARTDDMDKIIGFEYGADDYVTKPFNILELKARIRAMLRRTNSQLQADTTQRLTIGGITLDFIRHVAERNGQTIELTAREFDLIELFMKNPGRVYSRENLLNIVWGRDYQGDIRTVDVHVHRLRDKLEANPAEPDHLMTKWGVGYYFKG
ncbi:MAG: response regulator transcription factor [Oscillospiraceae bacterium]|nr:response regulator transcription factor [Oscillospiraceae bacterium]